MLRRRKHAIFTGAGLALLLAGLTWGTIHIATTNLHDAITHGDLDRARWLLRMGANVDVPNRLRATPLHVAARLNRLDEVEFLLDRGATINAVDFQYQTPLHVALGKGHVLVARLLISRGADIEAVDVRGETPLLVAADRGLLPIIELLASLDSDLEQAGTRRRWTAMHIAAAHGNVKLVRRLHELGASIDPVDRLGQSPLHVATSTGNLPLLTYLVEQGAEVNCTDHQQVTPLMRAASQGDVDCVDYLLTRLEALGHDPALPQVLRNAVQGQHADTVELLLEHCQASDASTVLLLAAQRGKPQIVRLLLEAGAQVDAVDEDGRSALHLAASEGHLEVMRQLFAAGIDVNRPSTRGATALHNAAWAGRLGAVELLLSHGANATLSAGRQGTPLHWAVSGATQNAGQHLEIARRLIDVPVDINAVNHAGDTVLKIAIENQMEAFSELLIARHARLWADKPMP